MATSPLTPVTPNPVPAAGGTQPATGLKPLASSPVPGSTGTAIANPSGIAQANPLVPAGAAPAVMPTGALNETYGKGIGTALSGALTGLGTDTQQSVTATNAAAMITGNQGFNTLQGQQAAAGISPNSSSAALEGSNYWSQFDTNLQNTDASLELAGQNTLISTLQSAGQAHGPDESMFSKIAGIGSDVIEGGADIASMAGLF